MFNRNLLLIAATTALSFGGASAFAQDTLAEPTATPPAATEAATPPAADQMSPAGTETMTGTDQSSTPATTADSAASTRAQTAQVNAGAIVKDATGAMVGTIESVEGDKAVLATAESKVSVPVTSFAPNGGELVFGMTAAEVNAAAQSAAQTPGS